MNSIAHFPVVSMVEDGKALKISLKEILQKTPKTLLYFYPKDNTPGCTLEWQDFSKLLGNFLEKGIQVIGVSKDSDDSHLQFQESCSISLPLISDTGELCDMFSVMGEKNMYGKILFGLLRSTFLLDSDGNILQEWRSVRAKWHAEKILTSLT